MCWEKYGIKIYVISIIRNVRIITDINIEVVHIVDTKYQIHSDIIINEKDNQGLPA